MSSLLNYYVIATCENLVIPRFQTACPAASRALLLGSSASRQIVNKAWNFTHVPRNDGLSCMAYTEQITFLLFLDGRRADQGAL